MAPLTDERTRHLLTVLAKENSKTGAYRASPAKFRETALDTHKSSPAEDFGPSPDLLPAGFTGSADYLSMMKTQRTQTRSKSTSLPSVYNQTIPADQIQYASVFKPRPEQEHACSLAREHRDKMKNSEWALLDTLEVELFNNEKEWRQRMKAANCNTVKKQLDAQVTARLRNEEKERVMAAREEELVRAEVEANLAEVARKEQEKRERNVKLRVERLGMLNEAREQKAFARDSRRAEEAQMLADIQARLEQEKQHAAIKAEERRKAAEISRAENDARIQALKNAKAQQALLEQEMVREGLRLAEKQAQDREEANRLFKENIEKRVRGAGQKVLEDNRAMIEREERLMKQMEEKMEAAAQAKERAQKEKKQREKEMLLKARQDALSLKEQKALAAKVEVMTMREVADQQARDAQEAQDRKMAAIRERALGNQTFLRTQMDVKEQVNVEEFVGMSEAERQLNARLLKQAVKVVGPQPRQLKAQW